MKSLDSESNHQNFETHRHSLLELRQSHGIDADSRGCFFLYLEEIFEQYEYQTYDKNESLGMGKLSFLQLLEEIPMFLAENIFNVVDTSKKDVLYFDDFCVFFVAVKYEGMDVLSQFFFDMLKSNDDELLTKEAIEQLYCFIDENSYAPQTLSSKQNSYSTIEALSAFPGEKPLNFEDFNSFQEKTQFKLVLDLTSFFLKKISIMRNKMQVFEAMEKIIFAPPGGVNLKAPIHASNSKRQPTEHPCTDSKSKPLSVNNSNKGSASLATESESVFVTLMSTTKNEIKVNNRRKFGSLSIDNSTDINPNASNQRTQNKELQVKVTSKFVKELNMDAIFNAKEKKEEKVGKTIKSIAEIGAKIKAKVGSESLKKYYLALIDESLFFYFDDDEMSCNISNYSIMRSLPGVFVKNNNTEKIENEEHYSFTLIFHQCQRITCYFINFQEYKSFIEAIRRSIDYTSVFEKYNLVEEIGIGGFGKVFTAEKLDDNSTVAIKILNKEEILDWKLLKTELDISKVVKHENLVETLGIYQNSSFHFLVLEYIQNGSLASYLKEFNILHLCEARTSFIAFQTLKALEYLAKFGIIHGDLKPSNFLIKGKDYEKEFLEIKIADFGLARILSKNNKVQGGGGTVGFSAPEIVLNKECNNSADVWSLGINCYYLLTGNLPYKFSNSEELKNKIKIGKLSFDHPKVKISSLGMDFIKKCLVVDPKGRADIKTLKNHSWVKPWE